MHDFDDLARDFGNARTSVLDDAANVGQYFLGSNKDGDQLIDSRAAPFTPS